MPRLFLGEQGNPIAPKNGKSTYFTEFTCSKAFLYFGASLYVVVVSTLSLLQPFYFDICKEDGASRNLDFENPAYDQRICTRIRAKALLYLTPEECSFGRRIVIAAVLGGLIGWERRSADRPAGIRTMSLVSLGACLFSVCSAFAFIEGPMNWDGSRVAAAIPSGVGFLGAGIIWKQVNKENDGHTVHGLTTAASVWLSAAVGIACSGELYFAATFSVSIMLVLLRFGPRFFDSGDDEDEDEDDIEGAYGTMNYSSMIKPPSFKDAVATSEELEVLTSTSPTRPTSPLSATHSSLRRNTNRKKKPSLME